MIYLTRYTTRKPRSTPVRTKRSIFLARKLYKESRYSHNHRRISHLIHMETSLVHIDVFAITGITTRTANQDEQNPSEAKIGPLWGRFYAENIRRNIPDVADMDTTYGVYSNYESDIFGKYNLTVGIKTNTVVSDPNLHSLTIQAGDYMVFRNSGSMPQMVIDTWMEIWRVFTTGETEWKRDFATDFEKYEREGEVAIYIGVSKK